MYKVSLIVDTDVLDAIDQALGKSPILMKTAYERNSRRLRSRLQSRLRTEPGRPRYPIRWKSERQRRAFFATNGFGRDIPTQRTHQLANGWEVSVQSLANGGAIEARNDTVYLRWVEGKDQQPFHSDTEWLLADDEILKYSEEFNDILIETWFTVSDPFAGVS